tara:strand:+ start:398 stop:646 length:249 start_codon:yes stop_codon:yes gene_type:complete
MLKIKKGQGLPIRIIVVAAILLIVMFLVILFFRRGLDDSAGDLQNCGFKGGKCEPSCGENSIELNAECDPPTNKCCSISILE